MVAADRQRVPIAGNHPHRQVFTGQRQTCGDRRRAAVDRVQAIGFQVIREPARAADAADEDDVLPAQSQLGQEVAHRVEDDVVTATGAPPDLLVAGEVLGLLRLVGGGHTVVLGQHVRQSEIDADQVSHELAPAPTVAAANLATIVLSCSISASVPPIAARMRRPTSSVRKATPWTLVTDCTSTKYLPRSSSASWPRFISGATTCG